MQIEGKSSRWLLSVVILAVVFFSWTRYLDELVETATSENFKQALAVAAIARALNGVVSVAQGTEIAIQPVGVGVTLTIGEILDPLNDLIERFSMLALAASIALGLQLTLSEIASSHWVSGGLTVAAGLLLLVIWWRPATAATAVDENRQKFSLRWWVVRIAAFFIFARFVLALSLLVTHFFDVAFLHDRQIAAMSQLDATSVAIDEIQSEQEPKVASAPADTQAEEEGLFARAARQFDQLLDQTNATVDVRARLTALQNKVEESIVEMINLIVIFVIQTLLLPLLSLWLGYAALQNFWRNFN